MKWKREWIYFYIATAAAVLLLSHWGSRVASVFAENTPPHRVSCVLIDPGHGGVDGGATSCAGILESQYNLEISLRLRDLLHLLGYDTRIMRTTDISIYTKGETIAQKKMSDLKERVRITNETENGILLSIHQNTFSDSRYSGAQVFYAKTEGSRDLAETLQAAFATTLNPGSHRSCKKSSGIYLMEHIDRPGVLIECGFLSNPEEEAKLRSKSYQQQLCCVIVSSLDQFLSNT